MLKHLVLIVAAVCISSYARADLVITVTEVGNDVVFSGGGSLFLGGLNKTFDTNAIGFLQADTNFRVGPNNPVGPINPGASIDSYEGVISGPTSIGTGTSSFAPDTHVGDAFGIRFLSSTEVEVPNGYASGADLDGEMTFLNHSFATLGITPNTYTWSWEVPVPSLTGGDISAVTAADLNLAAGVNGTFTERVTLTVVPEPSAFLYGGLISGILGCGLWAKRWMCLSKA